MDNADTTTPEMPESIYAWGHWNAVSVTGEWSANTHDRDDGQDYIRADLIGVSLSAPAPAVDATPDLRDVVRELVDALTRLLATVERLDISEGVCCCGDSMENHSNPMVCGHSPVDMGEYHHGAAIEAARAAIAKAEGVL